MHAYKCHNESWSGSGEKRGGRDLGGVKGGKIGWLVLNEERIYFQ